ncbi:MAG: ABC transporter permease [Anaerolineae bacterium]|jgi:simple sugar transport system permease protein|nr:ABC transporter permease [Anaerolineae bacterium]
MSEQNAKPKKEQKRKSGIRWRRLLTPLMAIVTALILGAVVIVVTDTSVYEAFDRGFGAGSGRALQVISTAYGAFFAGAFGDPARMVRGLSTWITTGDGRAWTQALYPITETLRYATPLIFAGLAVAVGFRGGLFNIGAEGQYFIAGLTTVFVAYSITGLPWFIHAPLAILAGFLGGALWGIIPGLLKAKTGAHEVINTIMMNYIAFRFAEFMLDVGGPMARGDGRPVSPVIEPSARLAQFFPSNPNIRFNVGFLLALAAAGIVYWLLFKTTVGYEIRTVGQNPRAAKYAGMSVARTIVLTMAISGGLAGLAAAADILGVIGFMPNAFSSGYGFDAIALALLGNSHPFGVVLASLLFGALQAGARNMQAIARVPLDLTEILQGLIIIFIAAPAIIRSLYRMRSVEGGEEMVVTRGWGQM